MTTNIWVTFKYVAVYAAYEAVVPHVSFSCPLQNNGNSLDINSVIKVLAQN